MDGTDPASYPMTGLCVGSGAAATGLCNFIFLRYSYVHILDGSAHWVVFPVHSYTWHDNEDMMAGKGGSTDSYGIRTMVRG